LVTIKVKSFADFKSIIDSKILNPYRAMPDRFHTIGANGTVAKITQVFAQGNFILLYVSPTSETILPTDPWFAADPVKQYSQSIEVTDISEAI